MDPYVLETKETLIRLLLAVVLGGLVGWDRERNEGSAGLRTHMLVCVGSALVMIVSSFGFHDIINKPGVSLDPSRVAAQVISGISFLGAGTILFLKPQIIKGLTTAAGLWSVAAVGLATGGGLYLAATATTVIILIVLAVVKPIERSVFGRNRIRSIHLSYISGKLDLSTLDSILAKHHISAVEMLVHYKTGERYERLTLNFPPNNNRQSTIALLDELKSVEGIGEINSKV